VSAILLVKISEGKIGTTNPQFFASVRRLDLLPEDTILEIFVLHQLI
jgi:hypothetical protein